MVQEFCASLMRGVVATGLVNKENAKIALEIMRQESIAFFTDDKYKNHRDSAVLGTLHDGYIMADLITECAEKIREETEQHEKI